MIFDRDINKFIKELEERISKLGPTKYDYIEYDILKGIVNKLKRINTTGYHDVDEYYKE